MKVFVKGLNSCGMRRTNVQRYLNFIEANGHELVTHPDCSDVVLLWTCAFRGDFRDNSMSEIRRYLNEYSAELIVVGCLPDIDRELLVNEYPGRFIAWRSDEEPMESFFGSASRLRDTQIDYGEEPLCDDVEKFKKENPTKDATFVDQFIKLFVAEGCDFQCTYCAEILAFPPFRSFPVDDLKNACRKRVQKSGSTKVMLLGDCIGDYGKDIGYTLPRLIQSLREDDSRLTFGLQGFNPSNFLSFFDEMERMLRAGDIFHMQLPIQSASDSVLKNMKRTYTRDGLVKIFELLKELNYNAIDTHLLIGFPGETEEDFQKTLDFVLYYKPRYVLVSKYMETPAMPAFHFDQKIPRAIQDQRLAEAGARIRAAGLICNTDDSDISEKRCENMNRIEPVQSVN
ncbi:MAG: radical SAM protein [Candidatus Hinthialibacter antarcticus]|nr:radical SAM protein [Candidatus Hinthialibacter antarcticus]